MGAVRDLNYRAVAMNLRRDLTPVTPPGDRQEIYLRHSGHLYRCFDYPGDTRRQKGIDMPRADLDRARVLPLSSPQSHSTGRRPAANDDAPAPTTAASPLLGDLINSFTAWQFDNFEFTEPETSKDITSLHQISVTDVGTEDDPAGLFDHDDRFVFHGVISNRSESH